jgi:hypothetical protein
MPRPSKLTLEIQKKIGYNVALGLTYSLAAEAAGIAYKTLNEWLKKERDSTSGRYFEFYKYINRCNADGALNILQCLNDSAKAGGTRICMWILERRLSEDFGRRVYRKMNVVAENLNQNVEIVVTDADNIRKQIIEKSVRVGETHDSPID